MHVEQAGHQEAPLAPDDARATRRIAKGLCHRLNAPGGEVQPLILMQLAGLDIDQVEAFEDH